MATEVRRAYRVDLMIPMAPEPTGGDVTGAPIVPGFRVLGDGSLAIPARISRTGILEYTYDEPEGEAAGGRTVREYRSPAEVFAPESLESFKGITVCYLHPDSEVNPDNWQSVSIGTVADNVRPDGIFVACDVIVKTADAIAMVKSGEARECSAGYTCGIIEEPGTSPEGEPYDAIQVGILANHVALGPRDWGRSGGEVRLYTDSKHGRARRVECMRKVDQMDPEELLAKYNETSKALEEAKAKIAELEAKLAADGAPAKTADGEEEEQTEDGTTPPAGEKKGDGKRMTADDMFAKIERKNEILAKVKSITKNDSLSGVGVPNRDLILMGLRHVDAKFDDKGKSTDYLRATLDHVFGDVIKQRAQNREGLSVLSFLPNKVDKLDGAGNSLSDEQKKADDEKAAYDERQRNRWKGDAKK